MINLTETFQKFDFPKEEIENDTWEKNLEDGISIEISSEIGVPYGQIAYAFFDFFTKNAKKNETVCISLEEIIHKLNLQQRDKDEFVKQLERFEGTKFCINQKKEYIRDSIYSGKTDKIVNTISTGYIPFFDELTIMNSEITYKLSDLYIRCLILHFGNKSWRDYE